MNWKIKLGSIIGIGIFLPSATKLGQGYVFTGVCDSVHGGEYLTRYIPPRTSQVPPGTRYTPPGPGTHPPLGPGTPPGTRYTPSRTRYSPSLGTRYTPLGPGTPPQDQVHLPCRACWEIRSTRGRYASYWNAILLLFVFYAYVLQRIKHKGILWRTPGHWSNF